MAFWDNWLVRVGEKNTKAAFLVLNSSIKICLTLQVKVIFWHIERGLDFEIGQAIVIGIYSRWMRPGTIGFNSKLCKEEILIAKTKRQPFFSRGGDKHVCWCFDMRKLSALWWSAAYF